MKSFGQALLQLEDVIAAQGKQKRTDFWIGEDCEGHFMEYVHGSTPTLPGCRKFVVQYPRWYETGMDSDIFELGRKESDAMSKRCSRTICLEACYGGVNIRFRSR